MYNEKQTMVRFKGKTFPAIISTHRYSGKMLLEMFYDGEKELKRDWITTNKKVANVELAEKIAGTSALDWKNHTFKFMSYNLESNLLTRNKVTLLNM